LNPEYFHNRLLIGNALTLLPTLKRAGVKVRTCVTSPPYYKQKDYEHADQIGLEETLEEYLDKLIRVFDHVFELLESDGVLWINIGDCYNYSGGSGGDYLAGKRHEGKPKAPPRRVKWLKPKELCGVPWRLAFALQERGWYWRGEVVWYKANGSQDSATDRFPRVHEALLQFTKSEKYYFNLDATRQLSLGQEKRTERRIYKGKSESTSTFRPPNPNGPALRSVIITPTSNYHGEHFAVMSDELAEVCILSTSRKRDLVLDPFAGSGTTGAVARRLGRDWLLIELNEDYAEQIEKRIAYERHQETLAF
jgi:site-specific DNA-methyltransferase (cytosine-N4-specific)